MYQLFAETIAAQVLSVKQLSLIPEHQDPAGESIVNSTIGYQVPSLETDDQDRTEFHTADVIIHDAISTAGNFEGLESCDHNAFSSKHFLNISSKKDVCNKTDTLKDHIHSKQSSRLINDNYDVSKGNSHELGFEWEGHDISKGDSHKLEFDLILMILQHHKHVT